MTLVSGCQMPARSHCPTAPRHRHCTLAFHHQHENMLGWALESEGRGPTNPSSGRAGPSFMLLCSGGGVRMGGAASRVLSHWEVSAWPEWAFIFRINNQLKKCTKCIFKLACQIHICLGRVGWIKCILGSKVSQPVSFLRDILQIGPFLWPEAENSPEQIEFWLCLNECQYLLPKGAGLLGVIEHFTISAHACCLLGYQMLCNCYS